MLIKPTKFGGELVNRQPESMSIAFGSCQDYDTKRWQDQNWIYSRKPEIFNLSSDANDDDDDRGWPQFVLRYRRKKRKNERRRNPRT